jgi:L-gulono-1,4-lactone dehydrogenase
MSKLDNLTRARPRAGRAISTAVMPRLARSYVDRKGRVLSRRGYVIPGVEYAVPLDKTGSVLLELAKLARATPVAFDAPCRVRFSGPDRIPLSPAFGRVTAHITVSSWGFEPARLDRLVRPAMDAAGGRPHWGRIYSHGAATLAPLYPEWEAWQAVRRRLDPAGTFSNPYTDGALGPV